MARPKTCTVYLGGTLDDESKKRAKKLGVSRGEYLRSCIVYAMYINAFDNKGINADNLETVRSLFDSDFNEKFIKFLEATCLGASTSTSTNTSTGIETSIDTNTCANTDTSVDTDTCTKVDADIQTETKTETDTEKDTKKEVEKDTKKKKGVGKSKIPPAKDIVFEGTTI